MNRTKIEWTDYSWNPITGCLHGCWYCYVKPLTRRFKKIFPNGMNPTFYPERLTEPWNLKKPSKIFVCSISDLFAPWTPEEWMTQVLESIFECPVKHTFQLLTKNPERIPPIEFPDNVWVGTTVTGENRDILNIEAMREVRAKVRFVSFEPLLGEVKPRSPENPLIDIQWVIIGKLTGAKRVKLDSAWVNDILGLAAEFDIPVFMKDNLKWPYHRQEFPNGGGAG